MHEYVKRALVTALLIVSAAIVPSLPTVASFPDRSSKLARVAVSPLFWQIWDKLPSREISCAFSGCSIGQRRKNRRRGGNLPPRQSPQRSTMGFRFADVSCPCIEIA